MRIRALERPTHSSRTVRKCDLNGAPNLFSPRHSKHVQHFSTLWKSTVYCTLPTFYATGHVASRGRQRPPRPAARRSNTFANRPWHIAREHHSQAKQATYVYTHDTFHRNNARAIRSTAWSLAPATATVLAREFTIQQTRRKSPWDPDAFNKNLRVSFERSSLDSAYGNSYDPIGQKRSGDGATARTLLVAARRTVYGCNPAGQWGRASASTYLIPFGPNVTRRRERFFKSSKIFGVHISRNRPAIADPAEHRDTRATRRSREPRGYLSRLCIYLPRKRLREKRSITTGIDYILQTSTAPHNVFSHTSRWRSIEM